MPFRALQPVIDSLLRSAPHKARTQRERDQADEVYRSGVVLEVPPICMTPDSSLCVLVTTDTVS